MSGQCVRLHRVLRAPPERVFKAFVDPDALAKWLPPNGFTGHVDELDPTVGGRWRMTFTNLDSGTGHGFGGEYLEVRPAEKLSYTSCFDDPNLPGTMRTTVNLRAVFCGTELDVVQEDIPSILPLEACYLGWQESLILLGKLVEAELAG